VKTIEWFRKTVPDDEKSIILSFFKGSLDLVEGILSDELGIECARYDGDVVRDTRAADLKRFQTSSSCRVLLASVQSGGTGLNITQANHVCFLDRWFNPQVHDQAKSRVHRIGQKKDVKISYLDTALTVDCVMKIVNEYKLDNASVLLADGTSLGDAPRGAIGYKDLSGVIGNSVKAIREMRRNVIASNAQTGDGDLPIALPFDADQLFDKVHEVLNSRPAKAKPKKEDDEASSVSSSESKTKGYESGDNTMSDEDLDDSVKEGKETATKSMKWPASQESSSSNDSILNYDIHAPLKQETKPAKWPASQESSSSNDSILDYDIHASVKHETKPTKWPASQESSSSNDSILDYDIFSSKKPKAARSRAIGIDLERGSGRKDVIDLSLDDDDDDEHHATNAQITLPLDTHAGSDMESVFSRGL